MNTWVLVIIVGAALFLGGYGIFQYLQRKITMQTLNRMLDIAINGDFSESTFDESDLSALESKLYRYLSQSAVSSKNLLKEKETIETMISDISHQTKTPIANILLYSQLLSEADLPKDCDALVTALSSQGEKLGFLIGALIKTSRLETGIITVAPKENGVYGVLAEIAEDIRPKAEAKGITFVLEDRSINAVFDYKWTKEALYNIADNAVKYTKPQGTVTLSAVAYELFCRIDITDTGMGIEEKELAKIFGRFYRSPKVREEEGVGIGLYLAREIVTKQGGYIKVSSKVGEGSVFSVFLPKAN